MPTPDPNQRQIYDELNRPILGQGAGKAEILEQGLLHGAAHVWIWRQGAEGREVLLQKRAHTKQTWPGHYDISAAGHIDLNESPIMAALRETEEEIGLTISESSLACIGVRRAHLVPYDGVFENEFQWLYVFQLTDTTDFSLQHTEVSALTWKPLEKFATDATSPEAKPLYVPHGQIYYQTIVEAIQSAPAL